MITWASIKKAVESAGILATRYGRIRDRIFTGHIRVGPVTVYGANAMHYAVNVRTERGFICARPTTGVDGYWPWYLYVSPDGTPDRAWWGIGPGFDGQWRP